MVGQLWKRRQLSVRFEYENHPQPPKVKHSSRHSLTPLVIFDPKSNP